MSHSPYFHEKIQSLLRSKNTTNNQPPFLSQRKQVVTYFRMLLPINEIFLFKLLICPVVTKLLDNMTVYVIIPLHSALGSRTTALDNLLYKESDEMNKLTDLGKQFK